jgi:ABC-type phosphate/phosphonate transport system substrate-binding protein
MTSASPAALLLLLACTSVLQPADTFRLAIMQATKGEAEKFAPLVPFLQKHGVTATLVGMKSYQDAAQKFAAGEADGMFSGSGVAGTLIIKGLATPCVRPVGADGTSTYWATILAKAGTPAVTDGKIFDGKKVLCCALASSGEFYLKSLVRAGGANPQILIAANHGAAITALDKGQADYAVVKNRVWDKEKAKYPALAEVGQDTGENPDNTLMISAKADPALAARIRDALLGLASSDGAEAAAVKDSLKVARFIVTTEADFGHNLKLLAAAGVTKDFAFAP